MKKNELTDEWDFSYLTKTFKIMRITLFLMLALILQTFANEAYSQKTKLSLDYTNTRLEVVLDEIEDLTEFFFLANEKLVDLNRSIDLSVKNKKIDEILDMLFAGTDVVYTITDRKIILAPSFLSEVAQQQRSVSGKVTDETGQPLPGVTVVVKGTTQGTVTNADGNYTLTNISEDATLVFSFVGMRTQEFEVGNQSVINVTMVVDAIGIEEVVAIGYGTQQKKNVIGSVTSVQEEQITSAPVSKVSNALAGRLPGAIFMQESGQPGRDNPIIRIRGNSTLNENKPLIVIDGIPDRDINSLNAEDIESISILKDASAAIYGARSANGVLLITTKSGKVDMPTTFKYSFYEGFLTPTKLPEMADAPTYAKMIREVESYRGVDESNMMFSEEDIAKFESGDYPWTHPNTNWYDETLKNYSSSRNHNFSLSGGTKNITYYGSFGSQFDDGIFKNSATSYSRYNFKSNINAKINEYISVGLDISGIKENIMESGFQGSIWEKLTNQYPTEPARYPNGLLGPGFGGLGENPLAIASDKIGFDESKEYRNNSTLSANLKIPWIEGLTLSGYYAYDLYIQDRKEFQKRFTLYNFNKDEYLNDGNTGKEDGSDYLIPTEKGFVPEPQLTNSYSYSQSKTANIKFDYVKTFFEKHNVDAFIAYEQNEFDYKGFSAFRRYFLSDRLPYLFAGGNEQKDNNEWVALDARQNYFGRLSYNYDFTYYFQFSFRRDGSLRFSKEIGRWGNFPSVLLGLRPSEYEWWQNNLGFIDDFKLRLSWGKLGNDQVTAFQYLTSYRFSTGYIFGDSKTYGNSLDQANVPNPNITWEVANIYNLGWDALLFDQKINFETDLFFERRTDILVKRNVSVPRFTGIGLPDENYGIVENRGVELKLSYKEEIGEFNYFVSGNFAFTRNKVVEFDEPERSVPWQSQTGQPMGALLLYKSMGIFRDWDHVNSTTSLPEARPGDIIIEDYDKDGVITTDDRQLFPLTAIPEITFGLSFDVTYKNWELRGLIQGQGRALKLDYKHSYFSGISANYFQFDADDRWTEENRDATKPRAFERREEYWRGSHITDFYYADVSFVRLKNLQLSYIIPQKLTNQIKLKNAKVYISGQNLALIYAGNNIFDPETGSLFDYPLMRTISLGAQISF
jgi:TonB-dependent starch-binding outer membrane protein SusC